MNANKTSLSQREWFSLGATAFLASGLLTGLCVIIATVAGWMRV